ncbi:hypothetical protein FG05_30017 [Fusarium graminearum]|nr:hypothetical protein FG05_30017 [Fusarium graminearum]
MEFFEVDPEIKDLVSNLTEEEAISFFELLRNPGTSSDEELELRLFVSWFVANQFKISESAQVAIEACIVWAAKRPYDSRRKHVFFVVIAHLIQFQAQKLCDEVATLAAKKERDFLDTGEIYHLNLCIDSVRLMVFNTEPSTRSWHELVLRLYNLLQTKVNATLECDDGTEPADFVSVATRGGFVNADAKQKEVLFNFVHHLMDDYKRTRTLKYLSHAVFLLRGPADQANENGTRRMIPLGTALALQFRHSRSADDLNDAIKYITQGLENWPAWEEVPDDGRMLLARCLRLRSDIKGCNLDLDKAIDVMANLAVSENETRGRLHLLYANLAKYTNIRFHKQGDVRDIDKSTEYLGKAFRNQSTHKFWKTTLYDWREERSYLANPLEDLDYVIKLVEWALGSGSNHQFEIGLCNLLRERSEVTGSKEDLDRAIDLATNLVQSGDKKDNQDASYYCNSLAIMLHDRYIQIGTLDDLNHAIDLTRTSTDLDPDGNNLNALGGFLADRFGRSQHIDDLDQAIIIIEKAIRSELENQGLIRVKKWKHTLSNLLMKRHAATRSREEFESSLKISKELVQCSVNPDPISLGLYWSAIGLKIAYQVETIGGSMDDIEYATSCLKSALSYIPSGHPYRAEALIGIARSNFARWAITNSREDLVTSLPGLIECWRSESAPLRTRMTAVRQAAVLSEGEEACSLLREAIEQIPKLCPRSLSNSDKQSNVEGISAIAADAAYDYLRSGKDDIDALGLLESGRSIISNILMEMRVDTSELKDKYPDLADRFKSLTERLDSVAVSTEISALTDGVQPRQWELHARQRREADEGLTEVVENIRSNPGFESFLSPMKGHEFMAAADPDPIIVINVAPFGSDAFLIESHRIRVLHLPYLFRHKARDELEKLKSQLGSSHYDIRPLLEWLWTSVCDPCLQELGFNSPPDNNDWRRVWWVPTGPLCQLPLHAAGIHKPGSTDSVLDRVMSSYAMSVQALRHGQRLHRSIGKLKANNSALLVSMQNTPGCSKLPYAEKEIDVLYNHCSALTLDRHRPECKKSIILEHMRQCLVFHFAGHGESNPQDPSKSFLLLDDWQTDRLTVADIRELKLQRDPPFLAYLSACSTGSNEKDKLADEGVHLVGAFHLAGFRHVIGTLWSVSDQHSADIAKTVYETLQREGMTNRAVCMGLHEAVRKLRHQQLEEAQKLEELKGHRDGKWTVGVKSEPDSCWGHQHWVPYIHFGV